VGKPTMSDVARAAGVDVSTVSRALNERTAGMLRPETVERVMAAAEELDYRPNALARGLRTQRSHTIGMIIPDLTNPFFPPVVRGLEDVLGASGYTLILANTDNDPRREEVGLSSLVGRQVDGLLLATSHLDERGLDAARLGGLPVVLVNRRGSDPSVPAAVPDDDAGVTLVVDHLVELGHHHIAHVAGPQDTSTGHDRLESFTRRARELDRYDEDLIVHADVYGVDQGREACLELLDRGRPITAIFAANDLLAIGCLRALRERGIRVPDQVSLVGFNDMPLVDLLEPPLTTVRVPQYELGRTAGRLLLELLAGELPADDGHRLRLLPPQFVARRSSGPPPA
jgi:LacI family transcriptional regulator